MVVEVVRIYFSELIFKVELIGIRVLLRLDRESKRKKEIIMTPGLFA